jgi:hypothetical protein
MTRARWAVLAALLVGLDVYFLGWRLAEVQGNVEAQFIIVTPAFLISHLAHKRRQDRQHAERMQADDARHLETRRRLEAMDRRVTELHDFHVRGKLPERELRPWLHDEPPTT